MSGFLTGSLPAGKKKLFTFTLTAEGPTDITTELSTTFRLGKVVHFCDASRRSIIPRIIITKVRWHSVGVRSVKLEYALTRDRYASVRMHAQARYMIVCWLVCLCSRCIRCTGALWLGAARAKQSLFLINVKIFLEICKLLLTWRHLYGFFAVSYGVPFVSKHHV